VNGFHGGEWNDLIKRVTVRDNRAHSWVEAYQGTLGWTRVDATPSGQGVYVMSRFRQIIDSVELFWSRWVIEYDASRQVDLAKKIGGRFGFRKANAKGGYTWKRPDKSTAGIVVGVAVAAVVLWRLRRRAWLKTLWRGMRSPAERLPRLFAVYREALDRLGRARGWNREPTETPNEFVARLEGGKDSDAELMRVLTGHYVAARYGGREIEDTVVENMERLVRRIGAKDSAASKDAPPPAAAA
jgi:hypothetical protein